MQAAGFQNAQRQPDCLRLRLQQRAPDPVGCNTLLPHVDHRQETDDIDP